MKIQKINKEEYRKKMNLLLVALVGSLAVFAIVFGTILIDLFGTTNSIAVINGQFPFKRAWSDLVCGAKCFYCESC